MNYGMVGWRRGLKLDDPSLGSWNYERPAERPHEHQIESEAGNDEEKPVWLNPANVILVLRLLVVERLAHRVAYRIAQLVRVDHELQHGNVGHREGDLQQTVQNDRRAASFPEKLEEHRKAEDCATDQRYA